jgi:UDP-glucose 4,6-dehydratase
MILILGATGYIGQAFAGELRRRRCCFIPLSRKAIDYTEFGILFDYVREMKPSFVINAAGFTGGPNVDACESARAETLFANTLLPQTIARVCVMTNTPWGHVSSGSIYCGAKMNQNGKTRIEKNLSRPELRWLFTERPETLHGFTETDPPNFSFVSTPCSFHSGTKALAEESIRGIGQNYIWRPRFAFSERDDPRNVLSKLQRFPKMYDTVNSMSHLDDFVRACLDLWDRRAPFGTYNMTNPGAVTTRQVVSMIQRILKPNRHFDYWTDDEESRPYGGAAPRSSCILDVSKLLATGVRMRPVLDAIEDSLRKWQCAPTSVSFARGEFSLESGARS